MKCAHCGEDIISFWMENMGSPFGLNKAGAHHMLCLKCAMLPPLIHFSEPHDLTAFPAEFKVPGFVPMEELPAPDPGLAALGRAFDDAIDLAAL
jgi:hypothetical protein